VGGAGISEHLHQHVVPRWLGDSNFLPIIGHTKAVPELLDDTWRRLTLAWDEI
jgi:ATP adenylyltransferase